VDSWGAVAGAGYHLFLHELMQSVQKIARHLCRAVSSDFAVLQR
jgi:hypothetical protein